MRSGSAELLVTRHPGPDLDGRPVLEAGAPPEAPPQTGAPNSCRVLGKQAKTRCAGVG